MASKRAEKVQKTKEELMEVLDAGVKELREEISKKLESLSSPAQVQPCSSRSLQPVHYSSIEKRAKALQRASRFESIRHYAKKPKLTAKNDYVTVSMCKLHCTRRGVSRKKTYIEVRLRIDASYEEVCDAAAATVELSADESSDSEEEKHLALYRVDGTMIPNQPIQVESGKDEPWAILRYLQTFRSYRGHGNAIKMAIGYSTKNPSAGLRTSTMGGDTEKIVRKLRSATRKRKGTSGSHSKAKRKQKDSGVQKEFETRSGKGTQCEIEVHYAAEIGAQGLDIEHSLLRKDVFKEMNEISSDSLAHQMMDESIPWQPEPICYQVVQIKRNGKLLLTAAEDGTYTVAGDLSAKFQVVHQSDYEIVLADSGPAIPIFCIASGHCLEYTYTWKISGRRVGSNSCVLWINQPGVYNCHVQHNIMTAECSSHYISVLPEGEKQSSVFEEVVHSVAIVDAPHAESIPPQHQETSTSDPPPVMVAGGVMIYTGAELKGATNDFHVAKKIGQGGFGKVYRATLRSTDVAIKVLDERGIELLRVKTATQLKTEVSALTRFRHPNIISLMGYCQDPPALVFPFMTNLSLHHRLHRWKVEKALTWEQRVSILRDAAMGIAYLHAASPPVIHHDVNSSNILLDEHWVAKIADFGFSIELPTVVGGKTLITATPGHGLPGTPGYMAPEYQQQKYSTYSDVYAYGVVVLETYTGLLPYSEERDDCCLADHCEDNSDFESLQDKKAGPCPQATSMKFKEVAMCSIKRSYKKRAKITEIVSKWDS